MAANSAHITLTQARRLRFFAHAPSAETSRLDATLPLPSIWTTHSLNRLVLLLPSLCTLSLLSLGLVINLALHLRFVQTVYNRIVSRRNFDCCQHPPWIALSSGMPQAALKDNDHIGAGSNLRSWLECEEQKIVNRLGGDSPSSFAQALLGGERRRHSTKTADDDSVRRIQSVAAPRGRAC